MIINEEVTDGSAVVYHRDTSTKSFIDLLNGKYKAGTGDYYGRGFYSFLNKQSMYYNTNYGPIIYKLKVKNLQNFFIFNVNIYNKLFHSKMKTKKEIIDYQVKKFGITSANRYFFDDNYFNEYSPGGINSTPIPIIAKAFADNTNIQNRCNGIIYTGGHNDGDVCIIFPHAYNNIQPLQISTDEGKTWKSEIDEKDSKSNSGTSFKNLRKEAGKRAQPASNSTLRDLKPIYVQPTLCVYKQDQPRRYLLANSMKPRNVKGLEFNEGSGKTLFWYITNSNRFIEQETFDLDTDDWRLCQNMLKDTPQKIREVIEKDFNFKWDDLLSSHKFIKAKNKTSEGLDVEIKRSKIGSLERFSDSMFGKRTKEENTNKTVSKTIKGENGGSIKVKYDIDGDYAMSPGHRRGLRSYTVREKIYKNKDGVNYDALELSPGENNSFADIAKSYFNNHPDYQRILRLFNSCQKGDTVNVNFWIKSKESARIVLCRLKKDGGDDSKNAVEFILNKSQCPDFWSDLIGPVKKIKLSQTYDAYKKRYDFPFKTVHDEKLKKIKDDLDTGNDFADESFKKYFTKKEQKKKDKDFEYYRNRNYFTRMRDFGYQDKDDKNYNEHDKNHVTDYQKDMSKLMGENIINMSKTIKFTSDGKIFFRFKKEDGKYIDVNLDISKELSDKDKKIMALLYDVMPWYFHSKADHFIDQYKKADIQKNNNWDDDEEDDDD